MMRSILASMLLSILLTSCINFTGELNVDETLTLYHESHGRLFKRTLPPNSYEASLDILNKHTAKLKFTTTDGIEINTVVSVPRSVRIPQNNGSFVISHRHSSQIYDIMGTVNTSREADDTLYYGIENCSTYRDRYVCRRECGPRGCREICRWQQVRVKGDQRVEFRKSLVTRNTTLRFISPRTTRQHGNFKGKSTRKERVYTYRGQCRPYRY